MHPIEMTIEELEWHPCVGDITQVVLTDVVVLIRCTLLSSRRVGFDLRRLMIVMCQVAFIPRWWLDELG